MAMVQRTTDVTPGTPVGDVRAAVMTDLSARATNASLKRRSNRELIDQRRMESILRALPSTNREAFQLGMFAKPSTSTRWRASTPASAVPRHHACPQHADPYFNEIGFDGRSAWCLGAPFGKPGMVERS